MKPAILIIITFSSIVSLGQNITFDQAQNLRKKSLVEIETFLSSKNWSMTAADASSRSATFAYEVDQFDNELAISWIIFFESGIDNKYNSLSIQITKPNIYSTYISRLTANGYKLISSKIEDGGIKKIYKNTTTACIVTTSITEGALTQVTSYTFLFIDKTEYEIYNEPN